MNKSYILITPVHDEEEFVEETIKSVISQSTLPMRWLIVDDASTDRTPQIIAKYQQKHHFIDYYRLGRDEVGSYYSRRTQVFLAGYERIKNLQYEFMGALDSDISLEPTYYECIMQRFEENPKLGLASGIYLDKIDSRLQRVLIDSNHCPGAIHVFRRKCYEDIGGFISLKHGGDDTCAEIMARMKGWQTRSFPAHQVIHSRPVGTGKGKSIYRARFCQGLTEYSMGTSPVFMLVKSLRRAFLERPYMIGSLARMAGFMAGYLKREERNIHGDVIKYVRKEQMERLSSYLRLCF